jgi:hypothetical protein
VLPIRAHLSYFFKNYLRSHRYINELVAILVFHIFFWGFLYSESPDDMVWSSFGVLVLMLNIFTVPSLYLLEKGNSLYFSLVKPSGRSRYFLAKFILIIIIDFFWICLFAFLYGLRFMSADYFLMMPLRLFFIILLLSLSTGIWSLAYSARRPVHRLFILAGFLLIIFGSIVNKSASFPIESLTDLYNIVLLLLPPIQELIFGAVTLNITGWGALFLSIALIQIVFYFIINYRRFQKRDFI